MATITDDDVLEPYIPDIDEEWNAMMEERRLALMLRDALEIIEDEVVEVDLEIIDLDNE